jgi:hypothetical protein
MMDEKRLAQAMFRLVEFITKAEMTGTARTLIFNYFKESGHERVSDKAREAVIRYTQCKTLPSLEEIRTKTETQLSELEHMVLKMEYEASKARTTD